MMLVCIVAFFGCKKDNKITLSETSVTLHYGEHYAITATSNLPLNYQSDDEYYATVDNSGNVTAGFVGQTNINVFNEQDSKTFQVVVAPVSNLYPEPNINFGDSKSTLIARYGEPYYIEEDEEYNEVYYYYADYSEGAPIMVVCLDENNRVEGYDMFVDMNDFEELDTFLSERYNYYGEMEGVYVFMNGLDEDSADMLVLCFAVDEEMLMVSYMSFTDEKASIETRCQEFRAQMKH